MSVEEEYKVRTLFDEEAAAAGEFSVSIFGDFGYKERDFLQALHAGSALVLCAFSRETKEIVGYGVFYRAADQAEINSIAVAEDHRRRGVGTYLLKKATDVLKQGGARKLFLEVRRSNEAAIKFYEKLRFMTADIRRNFYDDPKEDALVMVKVLKLL